MPVNGIISNRDLLEFKLSSQIEGESQTGEGDGRYVHGASAKTHYIVNTIQYSEGFSLDISGDSQTDIWSVTYAGPGAPLGITWTGPGYEYVEATIVVENEKLYNGVIWVLQATLKVYAQGVERISQGIYELSTGLGPAYVPLWGIPLNASGGVSATTINLPTLPDTYEIVSEARSKTVAGWRYKEAGSPTWVELPVEIYPGSAPEVPGGCEDPGFPVLSGSTTYGFEIESYSKSRQARSVHESGEITECIERILCNGVVVWEDSIVQVPPVPWDIYRIDAESWSRSGSVWLFPNLTKKIERFDASDYGALWYRTEFPQTTALLSASCSLNGVVSTSGGSVEVHPYQNEIADNVQGGGPAAMEDTFAYESYAPWSGSASYTRSSTFEVGPLVYECPGVPEPSGLCPEPNVVTFESEVVGGPVLPPSESEESSRTVLFPLTVGTEMVENQNHAWLYARYWGSWCNPHWSYGYYRDDWDVDGAPVGWADYWGPIGSQWAGDSFIDASRRTAKRNHIVSCPLEDGGMVPWQDTFFSGLRWIGVSRWQTDAVDVPESVAMDEDSEPAWSVLDGTAALTFGASSISIVNSGAVDVLRYILRLDLNRFTEKPYFAPSLAAAVLLNWDLTNVDSIKVYVESRSGRRILLELNPGDGETTADETYFFPREADRVYAGSHAQDFGNLTVSDTGTDLLPTGVSVPTLGDPEYNLAFELHPFGQPASLRFEIRPIDSFTPVELNYPEFIRSPNDYGLTWESRQVADVFFPDGPGIRWGQWIWYIPGGGLLNPPGIGVLGYKSTIIDWLCARRILLENRAHDDVLTDELSERYDSFEGNSVGQVDRNSISFILPKGT